MSKKIETTVERTMSAYAASVHARIDHELKSNQKDADNTDMLKSMSSLALLVDAKEIVKTLTECEVNVDFAFNKRVSTAHMCMKAIDSVKSILEYAFGRKDKLKSNVEEVLRTIILHKNANVAVTSQTLEDCLNADLKIDDTRKALIFQRQKKNFSAYKRHAQMSERALSALNILKVNNKEFSVNDNALLQKLEARLMNK